jgi:hypothetical protein
VEEEVESPRLFNSLNISRLNISFNAGKLLAPSLLK